MLPHETELKFRILDAAVPIVWRIMDSFDNLFVEHRNSVPPRFNERVSPAPIRTGETIVLSCISQGIPPPMYLWFRESISGTEMIVNSERIHSRAGVLVLQSARVDDAGRYVCHANNTAGSESVELEVSIISSLSIRLQPQQVGNIFFQFSLKKFLISIFFFCIN